jgi:transposase InsO family protein
MCRALGVSRTGFYAAQRRGIRQCEQADQRLRIEIRIIHRASKRRYGSPRVHKELKAQGICCSCKRVERLMCEDGLRAIVKYLEVWYNQKRRHSALGYKSTAEYEAELALARRAA